MTVLELLVVVALLGLLMAIAAPGWAYFHNVQRLNAAQDEIFQAMRVAQQSAIHRHHDWQVTFRSGNADMQWAIHPLNTLPAPGQWQTMKSGVTIDPGETTLHSSGGIYRLQFTHQGYVLGQLGRLTLMGRRTYRTRRCVVVSTLLGNMRKARDRSRPDTSGRYCY